MLQLPETSLAKTITSMNRSCKSLELFSINRFYLFMYKITGRNCLSLLSAFPTNMRAPNRHHRLTQKRTNQMNDEAYFLLTALYYVYRIQTHPDFHPLIANSILFCPSFAVLIVRKNIIYLTL